MAAGFQILHESKDKNVLSTNPCETQMLVLYFSRRGRCGGKTIHLTTFSAVVYILKPEMIGAQFIVCHISDTSSCPESL